jgi:N-acetylneuraminic acid mutarotase
MRAFMIMALIAASSDARAGEWTKLPPLPDKEGFAGPFAGVSNGAILVAGGANFPDKKPWDGGHKVWYDSVFVLEKPDGKWKVAGKLRRPLGYGVSVTHGNGVVCVGGGDAKRHYADAFRLVWKGGKLATTELPALPKPLANTCGALVGDTLYVAGGQEKPDASSTSKTVYRMDLTATRLKWVEVEACPGGGRMLAVAAAAGGAFWLVGGADLVAGKGGTPERKYLTDAYRYDPGKGWKRIADLPHPVVAAPSPAPTDDTGFYILGGDDGSQVGVAPGKHRGFTRAVLRYDLKAEKWVEAGEVSAPRVTVPCVAWGRSWVVPSGEIRPGVRSPDVMCFRPGKKE